MFSARCCCILKSQRMPTSRPILQTWCVCKKCQLWGSILKLFNGRTGDAPLIGCSWRRQTISSGVVYCLSGGVPFVGTFERKTADHRDLKRRKGCFGDIRRRCEIADDLVVEHQTLGGGTYLLLGNDLFDDQNVDLANVIGDLPDTRRNHFSIPLRPATFHSAT